MKSQHAFSQTPSVNIPRSTFNLSHGHKTAFDADDLIPICQPIDVIPGSTFRFNTSFFMRLATPLEPILDNLHFDTFAFFVAYRTIWTNHERFHGAQDDPGDSISFTIPQMTSYTPALNSLSDYFTLPTGNPMVHSSMPFRAYNKCYNDWFRSAVLQDSVTLDTGNGPDTVANYIVRKRGKRFDYFTSSLPEPQRGTAVSIPLGDRAELHHNAADLADLSVFSDVNATYKKLNAAMTDLRASPTAATVAEVLYADLSTALSATTNAVRLAFATQHVLERDARSGTRYVESLKARWGVTSPDFRLQRAEYLGGGSTVVNVTPVQQQSGQPTPVANDKLGNLAGYGTANGTHSWSKSFVEHGVIIILGNLRGDISYSQGIDRYWKKDTRYDFVYPELVNIGEQSVLNQEIFYQNLSADTLVFGYQGRYDEHRFLNSKLTGLMRPDAAGTLASWHLSEDFASLPTLGNTFIQANTSVPLDRAIAISTEPHMIADFYHNIKAALPLPTFGVPGLTRL